MGRPNINQVRGLGDFSTVYNWHLVSITEDPSATHGDSLGSWTPEQSMTQLNYRCVSTTLPTLSDSKITVSIRGQKVFQPGVHTYSATIDFTFVETVDNYINQFLKNWREKCWEAGDSVNSGRQSRLSEVKKNIIIQRMNRQNTPIWEYKLFGCFLENYTQPTLEAEGNTFNPTMSLAYDYFTDSAIVLGVAGPA